MKTNFVSKFVLATAVVFFAGALATSSADAGKTSSAKGTNVTVSLGNSHLGGVGISASQSTAETTGKKKGASATAGGGYIAGGSSSWFGSSGFAAGVSHTSASAH